MSQEAPDTSVADRLTTYIDSVRPAVEAEAVRYSDIYSDFSLEAEGSRTLVYRYTFRSQVDAAKTRSGMASLDNTLEAMAKQAVFPEMRAAGIDDPVAKWTYQNADGSVIATIRVTD